MNDGCSRISLGAALKVWEALKQSGPVPAAFQGRIGGAKGVWIRSDSADTASVADREIWIEISESQLKFEAHAEDLDDQTYDRDRVTFEVLKWTRSVSASSTLR